jgi:hypothetical protein
VLTIICVPMWKRYIKLNLTHRGSFATSIMIHGESILKDLRFLIEAMAITCLILPSYEWFMGLIALPAESGYDEILLYTHFYFLSPSFFRSMVFFFPNILRGAYGLVVGSYTITAVVVTRILQFCWVLDPIPRDWFDHPSQLNFSSCFMIFILGPLCFVSYILFLRFGLTLIPAYNFQSLEQLWTFVLIYLAFIFAFYLILCSVPLGSDANSIDPSVGISTFAGVISEDFLLATYKLSQQKRNKNDLTSLTYPWPFTRVLKPRHARTILSLVSNFLVDSGVTISFFSRGSLSVKSNSLTSLIINCFGVNLDLSYIPGRESFGLLLLCMWLSGALMSSSQIWTRGESELNSNKAELWSSMVSSMTSSFVPYICSTLIGLIITNWESENNQLNGFGKTHLFLLILFCLVNGVMIVSFEPPVNRPHDGVRFPFMYTLTRNSLFVLASLSCIILRKNQAGLMLIIAGRHLLQASINVSLYKKVTGFDPCSVPAVINVHTSSQITGALIAIACYALVGFSKNLGRDFNILVGLSFFVWILLNFAFLLCFHTSSLESLQSSPQYAHYKSRIKLLLELEKQLLAQKRVQPFWISKSKRWKSLLSDEAVNPVLVRAFLVQLESVLLSSTQAKFNKAHFLSLQPKSSLESMEVISNAIDSFLDEIQIEGQLPMLADALVDEKDVESQDDFFTQVELLVNGTPGFVQFSSRHSIRSSIFKRLQHLKTIAEYVSCILSDGCEVMPEFQRDFLSW